MRTPFVAGNWKLNKNASEAIEFVEALRPQLDDIAGVDVLICPVYVALPGVSEALKGSKIAVGAQNCYFEESGAFTGEIAPTMLAEFVEYVIIGHSERRNVFGETDEMVNKKVKAALAAGLKPIVAVGESLAQNESGETESFVSGQVKAALEGVTAEQMAAVTLAYEPIWAIGTGKSATPEAANDVIGGVVRATVKKLYGEKIAEATRIQYGGSVKPNNMKSFIEQPEIDGALVGGASLKVDSFVELCRIAAEVKG